MAEETHEEKTTEVQMVSLAEHEALKAEHQTLLAEHEALQIRVGLIKKGYEFKEGDSECPAVPKNGECPKCHWKYGSAEPHAVA